MRVYNHFTDLFFKISVLTKRYNRYNKAFYDTNRFMTAANPSPHKRVNQAVSSQILQSLFIHFALIPFLPCHKHLTGLCALICAHYAHLLHGIYKSCGSAVAQLQITLKR